MPKSSRERLPRAPRKTVSIDALIDDVFGFNWQAIKTLGTSFRHPRRYTEAAWSEAWESRYTASFRVWFTLVAILFFFQFFWASPDSALIRMYTLQLEDSNLKLPDGVTFQEASQYFARVNFTLLPFVSAFCLFVFGFLFRAWGEAVPLVVRIRYVFAIVIPGTALSLPLFWLLGVAPPDQAIRFLLLSWLLPLPVDMWVSYRSVYADVQGAQRIFRAFAFAFGVFVAMAVSAIVSSYLAGMWITWLHSG